MNEKKKSGATKAFVLTGIVLLILGLVLCIGGMTALNWDFGKLSTLHYETRSYSCKIEASSVCVNVENSDIRISLSDTAEQIEISYPAIFGRDDQQKNKIEISADENTGALTLNESSDYHWTDYLFVIQPKSPEVAIILPASFTGSLSLNTEGGDITVRGGSFYSLELNSDYGEITLYDTQTSKNTLLRTDTGDIELNGVQVAEKLTVTVNGAGDIEADNVLAAQLSLYTEYGDIDIGRINSPSINLKTDYGDIEGSIIGAETDYKITASAKVGSCNLDDKSDGNKLLTAHTECGDIKIKFIA